MKKWLRPNFLAILCFGLFCFIAKSQDQSGNLYASESTSASTIPKGAVEIVEMRDGHSRTYQNPDGSFTRRQSYGILNFKDEKGQWTPVDETIVIRPEANQVELANVPFPISVDLANGRTNMVMAEGAALAFGDQAELRFEASDGSLVSQRAFVPTGNSSVSGEALTFQDVLPGIDRVQKLHYYLVETDYVLKQAPSVPAGAEYLVMRERIDLPSGWSIATAANTETPEELFLKNAAGEVKGTFWTPVVFDASETKEGATVAQYRLSKDGQHTYLDVLLSVDWLQQPNRQYPVTIDPTLTNTYNFTIGTKLGSSVPCSATLPIVFSAASNISNTNWNYSFRALGSAYRSEQRSRLVGPNSTSTWVSGCCSSNGTQSYNYNSGTVSPASTPAGTLNYVLQAYRTWGSGSSCATNFNYIVANTWDVTVTFTASTPPPSPTGVTASAFTVCPGSSVTFTASGVSGTAHWFAGSCGSANPIATGTTVTLNPTSNTTYYVRNFNGLYSASCASVIITMTSSPSVSIISSNSPTCNGLSNGSVAANTTSGLLPYTYNWSNGSSGNVITGVGAGTYSVTVTDGNGCTDSASTTLVNPAAISGTFNSTMPSCPGGSDGSASITGSGGFGSGYSYIWSGGFSGANRTGLSAGTYTVTITDGLGCLGTASVTIADPPALPTPNVTASPSSVCAGAGTSVTLSNSTNVSNATFSQTTPIQCTFTTGGVLNYAFTGVPSGATGNATLTVFYRGDLNLSSEFIAYVGENSYTLGNSFAVSACQSTYSSRTFTVPMSVINTWASDGIVNVIADASSAVGGCSFGAYCSYMSLTFPYGGTTTGTTYWYAGNCPQSISGNIGTGDSLSVVPTTTTTYYASVFDGSCWSVCDSVTVPVNPLPAVVSVASNFTICEGASTTISALGANTYVWSPATGLNTTVGATVQASPTTTTTYTVVGTDANGCSASSNTTITVNPAPTLAPISTSPTCNGGNNGVAGVTASGATAPYSYNWIGGISTSSVVVAAGTYTVTVSDNQGCSSTLPVTVTNPAAVTATFSSVNASCFTASDGIATAFGSGGSGFGYSYVWPSGTTNALESGLAAGTHTVTITDGIGCTGTATVTISSPPPVTPPSVSTSTSSVCQGNTNPVTLSITGGGSGSFNQTLSAACSFTTGGTVNLQYTGLPPNPTGNGTLTVFYRGDLSSTTETIGYSLDGTFIGSSLGTGGSDCQALYTSRTFTISNSQLTSMVADGTINILADATSGVNNFCYSNNTSFCTYTTLTYNYVNSTSAYWFAGSCSQNVSSAIGTGSSVNVTPTTTTTYYAANLDNGCWSVCDSVTVTVNPLPTVSASVTTSTICQGTSTTLTATGASSYSWSPTNGLSSNIGATVTASPSTTTTYTVTGTDANGCSNTATVQVIVSPAPNIVNILPTQPSCATGSDGSAVVTAFGTGTLTYAWSNGATTASNTGLAAGVYTVTVTDAVGCTSTQTTIVNAPAGVSANFSSVNATCATTSDGLASVFGTSGAGGPFTYLWPSGNTNQTESGLSAGTHTVTITDGNGCTGTAAVTISAPAPLATPSITATNTTLCQGSTTSTTLSAVGGVGTGTYTQTKSISCSSITGGTLNFTFTGTPTGAVNNATLTVFYRGDLASSGEVISYSLDGTFVGSSLPTGSPDCQTTYSSRVFTLSASQINSMASNGSISMLADAATSVNNFCYGSNTSFCTYATLTYNYSNNTGLYWFANSCAMSTTAAIGSNAPITVSPTTTTTYYAALYDGSCWGFCDSITINVGTPPVVSATASPSFVCNGASATLTASGASTYAWSPSFGLSSTSGSTVTASPTVSFTYTVVGTDANGCTSSTTVPVTVLSGPSVSINPSSVSCAGGNDGSATSNVSGGLTPYSYNWSNGSSNSSVSGLSAGSISVTVTDGNGCTNTASATIFQPSALSLSVSTSAASCFTSTDGSGSAFGSGGTFPYTYSWSNGSTGQTVNNLPSGSVTVTVTDGNGCTTSSTGFVGAPPAIGAPGGITSSNGNSFCSNGSTATLLTVPGGSGVQTFTFTTGTACSFTTGGNLNFNIPNTPTNASGSGVLRVYYDGDIGQASEVITYSADGTTLGTSNLSPSGDCPTVFYFKDFTVSATQLNSWASNGSINVFGDGATSINNICIGGRSWCGYVELTYPYIGGATTYWFANSCSYNVSASVGSGDSLNVAPTTTTTYYAATFDGTCWSLCDSLTINVNPTPTIGVTSTAAICPGVSATLTATGASTYVWSPVTGLNTGTGSTVTAAPTTTTTYTVTGTDANGCTASASTTVTVNPGVTVSASSPTFGSGNNISCFGANDGSVNLSITSGASPYTFAWTGPGSFSSTSQNITGLATGSYQVTVTDANGCIDNTSITLTGPSGALTASASSSLQAGGFNLSCNGGSDGSITLAVSGGSPTYTYNWSGPSSFSATVPNPGNLSAGAYSVTVTDLAGCSTTTSISLTEPTTVSATVTPVVQSNGFNLSCANSSDGDITANASGGLSPYTYGWSGPGAYTGSGANITGLVVGTYSLTVTDANGCTYTDSQVLTAPTGVTTSITSPTFTGGFNISCAGNTDGSATVSASGGAGNYTFNWSGPGGFTATGASINNLAAGLYILTTTDGAGCQFTDSITLTEPVVLQAGLSSVDVTCVGGNDGSIAATPTGGNGPFTFNWSHDGTLTGSTAGNLTEGTYLITVTDANGCVANDSITIGFINNLPVVNLGNDTNICDGATLTLNPGSFVSYSWSGGTSNPTLDVTTTGFYSVTVTDNNTCSNTDTIAVFVNSNPVVNLGNDTSVCGSLTLDAGSGYSSYLWNDNSTASTLNAASGGTYTVTVSDGNGCTGSSSINVTISPAAAVNVTTVDASCGNTDGEATAAPAAGNGPYTYNWSNGGTSASISGLAAGTYLITLTTADGCTTVGTGSVNNSGAPSLSIIGSDVSCAGAADGSASVTPTGGATPYAFQWNSGQTSGAISNLSGGTYIVNVTDANGCVASASFVVNEPTPLVASGSSTLASCGQSNGSATVVVSGGIAPLTYLWDDPTAQNMNPAVNLNAGLYTVTVTDAGGCSIVTSIGVNNANAATLSVLGNNTTCADDTDGSAVVSVAGGLSPFTYLWDDAAGQTTPTASNLGVGTYNVVVTDSSGCVSTASVNITASNPAPIVDLGGPFAVICENSTYDIDAGSAFQTYLWSDGSTNQILSVSTPGTYTVTVTDFNGCEGIGELTLVTDPCVSVATLSDPFSLNYFPNPTSGELNIAIKGWTGKDLHLQVFNLQGQVVYAMRQDQMPANFQYQIDLSSEAQGIYLLRVSNGETIETRKVSIK